MPRLFEPVGEKSRRVMLVEAVSDKPAGHVFSYSELGLLFGLERRSDIQSVVNASKASVEANTSHTLVAVPNKGYRVASASEHLHLARIHQKKGRRQTRKARSKVENVNLAELSEEQRKQRSMMVEVLSRVEQFERRAEATYAKKEELKHLEVKTERTDDALQALQQRLARLESRVK